MENVQCVYKHRVAMGSGSRGFVSAPLSPRIIPACEFLVSLLQPSRRPVSPVLLQFSWGRGWGGPRIHSGDLTSLLFRVSCLIFEAPGNWKCGVLVHKHDVRGLPSAGAVPLLSSEAPRAGFPAERAWHQDGKGPVGCPLEHEVCTG